MDPAFTAPGRFWKGNIHTHSTLSDGMRTPADVCATYRDAGYDFLALTDHFQPKCAFPVADTRPFRTPGFTTILGAELHAPATGLGEIWHILAVGLPLDFAPTGDAETGRDSLPGRWPPGPSSPSRTPPGTRWTWPMRRRCRAPMPSGDIGVGHRLRTR